MNWSDSPKAARTFNKRNGVERFTYEPTVEDFEEFDEEDADLLWHIFVEQTDDAIMIGAKPRESDD